MEKSVVVSFVDAAIIIVVFLLEKYIGGGWTEVIKTLLIALQPFIVALIVKLLGIEAAARAAKLLRK